MQQKMKKIHINKKVLIIAISIVLAILIIGIILFKTGAINRISNIFKKEELVEFEYDIYSVSGNVGTVLLTFRSENGIEKIIYTKDEKEVPVYPKGKTQVALDYKMEDFKEYKFKVTDTKGAEKEYTVNFEIPRIKGVYTLIDGLYVNEPDVTGLVKEKTRYLYPNDTGDLIPGNWITDDSPANWYNYKNQNWANIYVENNGVESYYVWVPRYCYKIDTVNSVTGNERMDVKFINTYNEYIDGATGNKTTWDDLQAQGYQIPEAFSWENKNGADLIIPGYWASKYQLSELSTYKINYNLVASTSAFTVSSFTNNVSSSAAKYTYAINGKIVHESTTLENYDFANTTPDKTNIINVTALDANGSIVGSMTKELELVNVNAPDLTGLDKDTTFYVYWDEAGNEHNEIPISKDAPEGWYNYSYANWANIVTRNNGVETYFVWVPRYQYSLDQTAQRSNVRFIEGTGTDTYAGYQIPEAFTWTNQAGETVQLTGYWATKYQLTTEESTPKLDAEMSVSGNSIKIKNITGTTITAANTNSTNVKYEYYLNGDKLHEGTSATENYVYTGLNLKTTYTINIILRNQDTDAYMGAITKKMTTEEANAPVLTGLVESRTYYVLYDDDGNQTIGDNIKNDGSNMPTNWYNYRDSKWANIVVTDGNVVDGKIESATTTTYFTWVPRYEYRILSDRANLSLANRRTEVNFISGTNTDTTYGYQIPEAFTWTNQAGETVQIPGYWASKYQLSN